MNEKREFIIRGKKITLTKKGIEKVVNGQEPGKIRIYSILIGNKRFPIKQVLALATDIPLIGFTSSYAYNILTSLGFKVEAV